MKMMHGALVAAAKQIANTRGTDSDEHLDEIAATDAEEGDLGLACNRLCEQRLARARRPNQKNAFRDAAAEVFVLVGILQEVNDFLQFGLRFFDASNVRKAEALFLGVVQSVLASPETERPTAKAQPLSRHKHPRHDHQNNDQQITHDLCHDRADRLFALGLELRGILIEQWIQRGIVLDAGAATHERWRR